MLLRRGPQGARAADEDEEEEQRQDALDATSRGTPTTRRAARRVPISTTTNNTTNTARGWWWWWYSVPPLLLTALAATVGLWVTTGALRNNDSSNNSYHYNNNYYPAARATSSANNQKSNFRRPSNHDPPRKQSLAAPAATVFLTSDIQASLFLDYSSNHRLSTRIDRILQPDYGGLQLQSLRAASSAFCREIDPYRDYQRAEAYRTQVLKASDEIYVSSRYWAWEDIDHREVECTPPRWSYEARPNCNAFHELVQLHVPVEEPTQTLDTRYLAHGYYRDSFLLTTKNAAVQQTTATTEASTRVVLKHLRYRHDSDARMQRKMSTEAKTMEVLSASPAVSNIYGHCSTTLFVEAANELTFDIVPYDQEWQSERGRISHERLREKQRHEQGGGDDVSENDEPYSMNRFTAEEKLDMALQMAESLAEMHGNAKGVIVNDDVHPDQFLMTDDHRVISNDVNNAIFLDWNFDNARYCKYYSSYGGDYRAPEEYQDDGAYVDETVDLWPMGNLIHSLLTGLWPYYDLDEEEKIQEVTLAGERPYLHPGFRTRSFIERRLTEIMDLCHARQPGDRVNIFTVVAYLRETRRRHQVAQAKTKASGQQRQKQGKHNKQQHSPQHQHSVDDNVAPPQEKDKKNKTARETGGGTAATAQRRKGGTAATTAQRRKSRNVSTTAETSAVRQDKKI